MNAVDYKQVKVKANKFNFAKFLRAILFESSHLSPYLPVLKQNMSDKFRRMFNDQSQAGKLDQIFVESHFHSRSWKRSKGWSFFDLTKKSLDPTNSIFIIWYAFVFLAIIITYFVTGVGIVYGKQAWLDILAHPFTFGMNVFCIIVMIGDIGVQLVAGFIFRGMVILNKERVIRRYIHRYLVVDVILIVSMSVTLFGDFLTYKILKSVVVFKFLRMFEIDVLYLRKISTKFNLKILYVVFKQVVTIFIIAHTMGIIFYAMDYSLTQSSMCIDNPDLCWLYSATAYSPIMSYSWNIRYFYSVYWGIDTISTISYGDIAPNNPIETIYEIATFGFSFVTYGYIVNNIIQVIIAARNSKDNYRSELIVYTTYMDTLQISQQFQYQFREDLQTRFFEDRERNYQLQQQIKDRLPTDLKDSLLKDAYLKLYNALEYILFSSPSIVKLLYSLKQQKYTDKQIILIQGAPVQHLLYLHKGAVNITCSRYQTVHNISSFDSTDVFIALYEYFLDQRAKYTVTATKNSTLYSIEREKIEQQQEKFTDLRQNFKLVEVEIQFESKYKRIFYSCFFCKQNHHWYQCPQKFPDFKNTRLNQSLDQSFKKQRLAQCHFNVWIKRREMQRLQKIRIDASTLALRKIEQRIYEMKKLRQQAKEDFDTDVHYEWQFFKPNHNLSRFKQQWDNRKRLAYNSINQRLSEKRMSILNLKKLGFL